MVTIKKQPTALRIDWVDFAKGICIILVVLLHANHGVEKAFGVQTWLHDFVAWARPFRMPDFFLIAGLFLSRRIDRPWRSYLDTKVMHFVYFYVIWMSVWYVLKLPQYVGQLGVEQTAWLYPLSFVEPLGTLWFIYMLAVFFIAAKLLVKFPVAVVWLGAAILHGLHLETGSRVIDEFGTRFIFFYSGFVFAPLVFAIARLFDRQKIAALFNGLVIWAVVNGWLVFNGYAQLPVIELVLGYIGTGAVIATGVLLTRVGWGRLIQYFGQNTLPIFLSYFLFMAGVRAVILKSGIAIEPGLLVIITTSAGIIGPLILYRFIKGSALAFMFVRPKQFRLIEAKKPSKTKDKDHSFFNQRQQN